jgi:hypothetical protein
MRNCESGRGRSQPIFSPIDGRGARKNGHSSPGGAGSVGPSALDRRSTTSCSSVRSHRAVRSQRSALRRHHCRPPAPFGAIWQRLRASAGRLPSLRAAGQRFWPVREGPAHSLRARQGARDGALSRARALRPCAAAFLRPAGRRAILRPGKPSGAIAAATAGAGPPRASRRGP